MRQWFFLTGSVPDVLARLHAAGRRQWIAGGLHVFQIRSLIVVVASVLLLAAAVPPAHAQVCGNGVLEAGEACDDGNTLPGDCCTPICQLVGAGTVCRAAADVCDV